MNKQETVAIRQVIEDINARELTVNEAMRRIAEIIDAREPEVTIVYDPPKPIGGWDKTTAAKTPLPGTGVDPAQEWPKDLQTNKWDGEPWKITYDQIKPASVDPLDCTEAICGKQMKGQAE